MRASPWTPAISLASANRSNCRELRETIEAAGGVDVYVSTPLDTCEARDRKGLHAMARPSLIEGFTGINDPFEAPGSPDLAVDTAEIVDGASVGNGEQVLCGAASISSSTPLELRRLSPAIERRETGAFPNLQHRFRWDTDTPRAGGRDDPEHASPTPTHSANAGRSQSFRAFAQPATPRLRRDTVFCGTSWPRSLCGTERGTEICEIRIFLENTIN